MGLDLILTDADDAAAAAVAIGYMPAVTRGLLGWWAPALDADTSVLNLYSDGGATGAIVGTPSYASSYATFAGTVSYLLTSVAEAPTMTLGVVMATDNALTAAASRPAPVGNFPANGSAGLQIEVAAPSSGAAPAATVTFRTVHNTGTGGTITPGAKAAAMQVLDVSAFDLYTASVEEGVGLKLIAHKAGVTTGLVSEARPRIVNTASPIRIGSSVSTGFLGTCKIPLGFIHNVALTDAERAAQYAGAKAYLSVARGIAI
jgi:hypothetical protein